MVMTVISVATPMVSPSIVSDARSLCARRALKHCAKLSRTASIGAETLSLHFIESCRARAANSRLAAGSRTSIDRIAPYAEHHAGVTSYELRWKERRNYIGGFVIRHSIANRCAAS